MVEAAAHTRITNGDGYYCSRCGAAWDRDEEPLLTCFMPAGGPASSVVPIPVFVPPHPRSAIPNMNQTPDPMAIQIGGAHYKGFALQPTEFCMRNGLDPCIHAVVKYVARWRDKGGIEDLKKAIHYIQIREKFGYDAEQFPKLAGPTMVQFVTKNGIGDAEAEALYRLESYYAGSRHADGLSVRARGAQRVIEAIEAIIRAEEIKTA